MSHDSALDQLILTIIQTQPIAEQNELQESLKSHGYSIPQATLSRRLRKLQVAKVSGIYTVIDYNKQTLPLVLMIQISEYGLIVLQTHPGNASSLAYYLDRKYVTYNPQKPTHSGILGTIAGDDTVLLIIKNKHELNAVKQTLREEFPYVVIAE